MPIIKSVMSNRIVMEITQKQWMYGGAAILVAVSALLVLGGIPNPWVPMPLPIVVVALFTLFLFPFVTPTLYLLVLKLLSPSKHFPKIVLSLVLVFGILNLLYFLSAWEYGIKYQGFGHTKIVAVENLVGFGIALLMAVIALNKRSKLLSLTTNLFLFVVLSWCAFPYLGELP